jgi:YVTN family beta-propeller protein
VVELPTGTVTFLFTDIEGSTAHLKRLGERYVQVLAEQERIIRRAAEDRGGREIDSQGDSFFFVFPRANAAVAAVADAQRKLVEHEWPDSVQVRVRMGLHTGEPLVGEQRYIGLGVHRAARIGSVAHGGQVLLSNATRELVEEPQGVSMRDLGSYRLKDIDQPERLYQLDVDGLQTDFPPVRAGKVAEPRKLPSRTLLVGALAGVLAAAVAIPIFAFGQGGSNRDASGPTALAANSVGVIDPEKNRLVAEIPVGESPKGIAAGEDAIWVVSSGDSTLSRIDPERRVVLRTITLPGHPSDVAVAGSVWVLHNRGSSFVDPYAGSAAVSEINPHFDNVERTIDVPAGFGNTFEDPIAASARAIWIAGPTGVSKIDVKKGQAHPRLPLEGVTDLVAPGGSVWAVEYAGTIVRIDPSGEFVATTVSLSSAANMIAATPGFGSLWVLGASSQTDHSQDATSLLFRVDPRNGEVTARLELEAVPSAVAAGHTAIWIADAERQQVLRVDPKENRVVARIRLGARPTSIAVDEHAVWVTVVE